MKFLLTILSLILATIIFAQKSSALWKTEIVLGNNFSFTTFLNITQKDNSFLITSPKNADKRLFGGFKSTMARLSGKIPKGGILVKIEGKQNSDSLHGKVIITGSGQLNFKGTLTENRFSGNLLNDDEAIVGSLIGVQTNESRLYYNHLYTKFVETTQNNLYSKEVLQTKEWEKFQKELKNLCDKAQDDIELFLGFNMLSSELPFSHYNLMIQKDENGDTIEKENKKATVIFEEKSKNTAYLKIKNFSTSQEELAIIFPRIVENKNYENLIIDLRDNGGGGIEAAFEFARHIMDDTVEVGYFVTNRLNYSEFNIQDFETLPVSPSKTTDDFIEELKTGRGAKLVFQKPDNSVFSGKLYILTNSNTASTCESIVYILKNTRRATIVGERTAGAMLSAAPFEISGKYKLFLPLADFYTYDGVRLDQVGVLPDIEIPSEQALGKVLDLIQK
ncbi:MAG: S41 family peptidase [Moheibacter sp.]